MRKIRPLLAATVALLFYTVTDILVWQRIFEANRLVHFADSYHAGWFLSLAGYAVVGTVVMSDRWKDVLYFLAALFVGAYSGLEDVLYYVLDHKPMPAQLPWLSQNPLLLGISREGVIASVALWLAALLLLYILLFFWPRRSPRASRAA